jgi:hypothetical protein
LLEITNIIIKTPAIVGPRYGIKLRKAQINAIAIALSIPKDISIMAYNRNNIVI